MPERDENHHQNKILMAAFNVKLISEPVFKSEMCM